MKNVIHIGDFAVAGANRRRTINPDKCRHIHIEMDDNGDICLCTDCGRQLSPFWVLSVVLVSMERIRESLKSQQKALNEERTQKLHLLAARKAEEAWRSRNLVPACPHCHRGILATDGFGGSKTNKEIELARRKAENRV